jgi:hypothetical protein
MNGDDPGISGLHPLAGALEAHRRRPDLGNELTSRVHRLVEQIERGDDARFLDPDAGSPHPDVQALLDLIQQAGLPRPEPSTTSRVVCV